MIKFHTIARNKNARQAFICQRRLEPEVRAEGACEAVSFHSRLMDHDSSTIYRFPRLGGVQASAGRVFFG